MLDDMPTAITLGSDIQTKNHVPFDEDVRSSHMHVLGATGSGKSRFLLSLLQQDIEEKNGICLIDPHGELYHHILDWLSERETLLRFRKVRLIDVTSKDWCFGFNPLHASSPEQRDATVSTAVNAIAHVLGGGDVTQTPLLKETLQNVCLALSYAGLTLNEAPYLLNHSYKRQREYITSFIDYSPHRLPWERYNKFSRSEYHEYFSSPNRRFQNFISNPYVRRIFGQSQNVIDFRKAMDDGEIILVNLGREGGFMPPESSELIGRLLINNLMAKAFERPSRDKLRPFTLYVDEAHRYLSADIATILAETRKFGLHMVLAHQLLSQLKEAGDDVLAGVMGNARTKAVFALEDPEDAKVMAERVFVDEYDYEKAKRSLDRETVVGHEIIRLQSGSEARSSSEADGKSASQTNTSGRSSSRAHSNTFSESESSGSNSGTSIGEGSSASMSFVDQPDSLTPNADDALSYGVGGSQSTSESNSESYSESWSSSTGSTRSKVTNSSEALLAGTSETTTTGRTHTEGYSETLKPIIEMRTGGVYSLEEQKHGFMRAIMRLPQRHVLIAFPGQKSILVESHNVPDMIISSKRKARITDELGEKNPFVSKVTDIEREIEDRERSIKANSENMDEEEPGWDG